MEIAISAPLWCNCWKPWTKVKCFGMHHARQPNASAVGNYKDCELGMILIDADSRATVAGSAAAEEIGRLLPLGDVFVAAYRSHQGLKWVGDHMNNFGTTVTVGLVSVLVFIRRPTQLIVATKN